jgi:hypothetical protein
MTYQDPNDRTRRTYTDPARPVTNQDLNDPMGRNYTDPAQRGRWGNPGSLIGALVVVVLIVAAIAYAMNRNPSPSTASGPSATQSAPNTTGQGFPANTGTAR